MAKEMKINKALDIVNDAKNYNSTEVLEAVNLLKSESLGHPEYQEVLASFYDSYHHHRKSVESDGNYNDHDIVMLIFGGHEQYHNEYLQIAKESADKLAKAEKNKTDITDLLTFANLDALQSRVRALGISGEEPKNFEAATRKLNATMEYNLQHLGNKTALSPTEAEAAEHFVENIEDEVTQKKLSELLAKKVVSSYDEENGILNEADTLLQNDEKANSILESVRLYDDEGKVTKDFGEIANVLENVSIVDDEGNELDEENRRKHLQILFDAAKVDVHQGAIGTNEAPTHDNLVENVKEAFYLKIGQAAVASSIERPDEQDLADDKKFEEYLKRRDDAAMAVVERLAKRKTPIKFNSAQADVAVADTEVDAEKFVERLNRRLGDKKTKLEVRVNKLGVFAKNLWGKRHEITKEVVKNFKDNKWQHFANLGATLAMWGGMLTGYGAAAICGYALYTAASSQLWPLRAERQKLQAEAKAQGKNLGWWKAIHQAYNNKKDDTAYKARRRWGLVGGVAGLALGGFGVSAWGAANARLAATLSRSAAGLGAQGSILAEAKKEYKKDPSEANKSKLRNARIFGTVSLISSTALAFLSAHRFDAGQGLAQDKSVDALKKLFEYKSNGGAEAASIADSTSVADTTGATGAPEVTPEDLGFGGPKIPVDVKSFSRDELNMYNYSALILGEGDKEAGKAILENYYESFRVGKVESLPDGVTPAQYVDVMIRLHGYPVHSEAVKLMHRELDCDTFHPTDAQKKIIADAIKDVSYEHGQMMVAVKNDCGQLVAIPQDTFGQYIGKGDKMVNVDGQLLRLRKLTRVTGISADVDCGNGNVSLHNNIHHGSLPCAEEVVENTPAPKEVETKKIEVYFETDCPDLPDASMAENAAGYQTSGTYLAPIDRYTDYDAAVQHITGESFAKNEVAQYIKDNYKSASQAAGFNLKKFIAKAGGELLSDDENGEISFTINRGTVVDTKQGLLDAAHGAHIEISMKHDDFVNFAETGELPTRTQSVPLSVSDENYQKILYDDKFAYSEDKGDRSYFTTSVEGAEHFSTYAPVDFVKGSKDGGQLTANNDVILPTKQGNVVVHIDAKTGDITAKLGDKPVRFSSETQQDAEEALKGALEARYDVAEVSLAAPEGTLAKKCEMAMQEQSYVPNQVAENITSVGNVNLFDRGGR